MGLNSRDPRECKIYYWPETEEVGGLYVTYPWQSQQEVLPLNFSSNSFCLYFWL